MRTIPKPGGTTYRSLGRSARRRGETLWNAKDVIGDPVEARNNEDLDLINDLVNAAIYTDDRETVIPLLRAAVASINKP